MAAQDSALLRQWTQKRNAAAFRRLAERYAGLVYATAVRILHDTAAAEDVAQEVFLKLAQQPRVDRSLPAWLHRVTTNACLDALKTNTRRQKRESEWSMTQRTNTPNSDDADIPQLQSAANTLDPKHAADTVNPDHAANAPNPEHTAGSSDAARAANAVNRGYAADALEWEDIRPHLDAAIEELPEPQRAVIIGHFLHGQTHAQLARTLNISRPAVTQRIARALDQLRAYLKQRGITIAAAPLATLLASNTSMAAPATMLTAIGKAALASQLTSSATAAISSAATGTSVALTVKTLAGVFVATVAAVGVIAFSNREPNRLELAAGTGQESVRAGASATPEDTLINSSGEDTASANAPVPIAAAVIATDGRPFGDISGRVYDADSGQPIVGAEIHYSERTGPHSSFSRTAKTGRDGRYAITDLALGIYELYPLSASDFPHNLLHDLRQSVTVRPPYTTDEVDFALTRGITISGTVLKFNGETVADADVWGFMRSHSQPSQTDADGRFTLIGFPAPGTVQLQASSESWELKEPLELNVPPEGLKNIVLELVEKRSVSGVVLGRHYEPLPGVTVQYAPPDINSWIGTHTDDNGEFRLIRLDPGRYRVRASINEATIAEKEIELDEVEEITGLRLIATAALSEAVLDIAGRVTDNHGGPVAEASISGWSQDINKFAPEVRTDADGTFRMQGVAAGTYRLRMHHPDFSSAEVIADAGDEHINVVLRELGAIEGLVVDADTGLPLTEFQIEVHMSDDSSETPHALTRALLFQDEAGAFRLEGVNAGAGMVFASAKGYAIAGADVGEVRPGETTRGIVLRLKPALMVSGVVRNSSGEPISDAAIFVGELPPGGMRKHQSLTKTNSGGRFELEVAPQTTQIRAYHPRFGHGSVLFASANEKHQDVAITLSIARLTGIIRLNGVGAPAKVDYFGDFGVNMVNTDANGAFEIEEIEGPTVRLNVGLTGPNAPELRKHREVAIAPAATTHVEIDFQTGAEISGEVDFAGYRFESIQVEAVQLAEDYLRLSAPIDDSASFFFPDVAPGIWRVSLGGVTSEEKQFLSHRTIEVAHGERAWVPFAIGDGGRLQISLTGTPTGAHSALVIFNKDARLEGLTAKTLDQVVRQAAACCVVANTGFSPDDEPVLDLVSLDSGEYRVFAVTGDPEKYPTFAVEPITVRAGETTTLQINF